MFSTLWITGSNRVIKTGHRLKIAVSLQSFPNTVKATGHEIVRIQVFGSKEFYC